MFKVMVTRPENQMLNFAKSLEASGNRAILVPLIKIEYLECSYTQVRDMLCWSSIIIFTSQNTIHSTVDKINNPAIFNQKTVFAIGRKTQQKLFTKYLKKVSTPLDDYSSEGLLKLTELSEISVKGQNILILKGRGGRKKLEYNLQKRGANVKYIDCYFRKEIEISISKVFSIYQILKPDIIVITSGSILLSLVKKIKAEKLSFLFNIPVLVVSERLGKITRRLGFSGELVIAKNADNRSVLDSIKSWGLRQ